MNILVLCCNLEAGGGQIFALRLAAALAKYHNVYFGVVSHQGTPDELSPEEYGLTFVKDFSFDPKPIRVLHPFLDRILKKASSFLRTLHIHPSFRSYILGTYFHYRKHRFSYLLAKYKIDVINTHLFCAEEHATGNQFANQEVPVVISMHGCYESLPDLVPGFDSRAVVVLNKIAGIAYVADKNIAILERLKSSIQNPIPKEKIYYGYSPDIIPLKTRLDSGIAEDAFVFGMVARGIPDKGWLQAIEAFLQLRSQFATRELHLILVGEGAHLQELKNVYLHESSIHFVGFSKNPLEWIPVFDVGLLPTYFAGESLPNTIIEYLYCARPVIATPIGEIRNMLEWQGNLAGCITDYDSSGKANVQQMADFMYAYATDTALWKQHSHIAKLAFEKFDMEVCVRKYKELFDSVC